MENQKRALENATDAEPAPKRQRVCRRRPRLVVLTETQPTIRFADEVLMGVREYVLFGAAGVRFCSVSDGDVPEADVVLAFGAEAAAAAGRLGAHTTVVVAGDFTSTVDWAVLVQSALRKWAAQRVLGVAAGVTEPDLRLAFEERAKEGGATASERVAYLEIRAMYKQ